MGKAEKVTRYGVALASGKTPGIPGSIAEKDVYSIRKVGPTPGVGEAAAQQLDEVHPLTLITGGGTVAQQKANTTAAANTASAYTNRAQQLYKAQCRR